MMARHNRLLRHGFLLALVALLTVTWPAPARAADTLTFSDLIERALELDGRVLTVSGEAVGEVMLRGAHGWVNITDGTNFIGILAPAALLRPIDQTGRYLRMGDTIRVTGTFHRMDPEYGGDVDIRATSLTVVARGGPVPQPLPLFRLLRGVIMSLFGLATAGVWWWRERAGRTKTAD